MKKTNKIVLNIYFMPFSYCLFISVNNLLVKIWELFDSSELFGWLLSILPNYVKLSPAFYSSSWILFIILLSFYVHQMQLKLKKSQVFHYFFFSCGYNIFHLPIFVFWSGKFSGNPQNVIIIIHFSWLWIPIVVAG